MTSVAVVIPTRNRSALLSRTLRSVLAQRDVALRVIVVDDGSTDDTRDVVGAFGDPRVHLVGHQDAKGVSAARNRGVRECDAEWVAFLDDDDLWAPNKLVLQLASARATERAWSYGGCVVLSPRQSIRSTAPPTAPETACRNLPLRNVIPAGASNVIVRRTVLERVGVFDLGLRHMADWDLWIRLGNVAGLPAIVDAPLVAYRLHHANASVDTRDIAREIAVLDNRYAVLRRGRPIDRAYVYRWIAWNSLRMGRRLDALRAYASAVRSGDVASTARAIVGVVSPNAIDWRLGAGRSAYAEQARSWLEPLLAE